MPKAPLSIPASDDGPRWLSGTCWRLKEANPSAVTQLMQHYGLPELVATLLVQRGIASDDAEAYLAPKLRDLLPDPSHLKDMDAAVERIVSAIQNQEKIGIFGDYDVDGATSSALLIRYFRALGCETTVHIPDRQKEGYGPNIYGMQRLKDTGVSLVITVDTGTLAHTALQQAKEIGLEVIVVDHHQGEATLPPAVAVINPNRFDEDSPMGHLAAVGVTFLLLVALNAKLKEPLTTHSPNLPPEGGGGLPNLLELLDIVALGTVCDVVPLTGLNRAFVKQGLKILRQRQNLGLTALMDIAGLEEAPTPYHLGFVLGPRINAGGRVGQSELGTRLLSTESIAEATDFAKQLDHYNKERKAIEAQVQEEAAEQVRTQETAMRMAQGEGWHEGIIGIVAGRLKESFNQPAAVISWNSEGVGKASARSVKGIDLGKIVIAARQQGLLEAGGGHSMAAGFTVKREQFPAFQAFVEERMRADWQRYQQDYVAEVDAALPLSAATIELADMIDQAGPFGSGNPTPRFLLQHVVVTKADRLGTNHLRCFVADSDFAGRHNTARLKIIAFGIADTPMGQTLLNGVGRPFHMIGKLRTEYWRGKASVTFFLDDLAPASV